MLISYNLKLRGKCMNTRIALLPFMLISYQVLEGKTMQNTVQFQLDKYMQELTRLNRFSGTVLVAKGDTILLSKGYGFAHREFEVPNRSNTRFPICSITKLITATAIMNLQEKGLLRVSDKVSSYLPDFPRGDDITIHQLLSHTSGFSGSNMPLEMVVLPTSADAVLAFFKAQPLEFQPGSNYQYSNGGYLVLGSIIEKVSGMRYDLFIKKNILDPLQMHESIFPTTDFEIIKNCASGYCFNANNELVNGYYVYRQNFNGSGGLHATVGDLYLFGRALTSGRLVMKESLQSMFTAYHPQGSYGYGCFVNNIYGHRLISHGGMLSSGFKSTLSLFTDDAIIIAILSNCWQSWVDEARDALLAIVCGLPYDYLHTDPITIEPDLFDEYAGIYNHPLFPQCYTLEKAHHALSTPDQGKIVPVSQDQFMISGNKAPNMVYQFIRDEVNKIVQLRIKGGGPYFEVRCEKIM